jgi:alanyl aminopeptidase
VSSALALLARLRDNLLGATELPAYERLVHTLVARRTQEVGLFPRGEESSERKLLRPTLVSSLAFEANDRDLRAELERLGRARLGLAEDARVARLPNELVDAALSVAVQNGGNAVIERVKAALSSTTDGLERGRLLGALGANRDPALTPNVLELTLAEGLRTNERLGPIFGQMGERNTREAAYAWVTTHFDALVARLSKENAGGLVSIAGAFCSREHAERARQFYTGRVEQLSGGPRNLRLALESVELCAAFAEAHRKSAREYFARAPAE